MKGRTLRNFLGGVGSLAYFLQGYTQSILNGLVTLNSFIQYFPQIDTVNTQGAQLARNATLQGTVVAVYEVGGAFGGILCFFLATTLGRKKVIFYATVLQLIGGVLQTSAFHVAQLAVGRVLTGVGMGAYTATIPMWICECISAAHRGKMIFLCGGLGDFGMVVANWVDFGMYYAGKTAVKWRLPLALQLPGAVAILGLTPFLPESPRWLLSRGHQGKAVQTLAALSGRNGLNPLDPVIHDELDSVMSKVNSKKSHKLVYRVFLAVFINMMGCLTGISILTFFSTEVLETQLHFTSESARLFSAFLEVVRLVFAFVSMALVDKVGRRPLILWGAAGMCISMIAMTVLTNPRANEQMLYASLAFQFSCMVFYPIGFHLMPTMYASEIAPAKHRHKVAAASNCVHWLFNFMIAEVTPLAFNSIGCYYYALYACTNAVTFVVVYLLYLETNKLSLEEIEGVFATMTSPLTIHSTRRKIIDGRYSSEDDSSLDLDLKLDVQTSDHFVEG